MQKRNILKDIIMNYFTCGIYGMIIRSEVSKELNKTANGGPLLTESPLRIWLMTFVTCGIWGYLNDARILQTCGAAGSKADPRICSNLVPIVTFVCSIAVGAIIGFIEPGSPIQGVLSLITTALPIVELSAIVVAYNGLS